jgi:hypothetical protein
MTNEAGEDIVAKLVKDFAAAEWTTRYDAVNTLAELCQSRPTDVVPSVLKLFTAFSACLSDSNSKVNLFALQSLVGITCALGNALEPSLAEIVKALSSPLASSSAALRDAAEDLCITMTTEIDAQLLIGQFSQAVQFGNVRVRAALLPHITQLVRLGADRCPKAIVKHVVPLGILLLGEKKGGVPPLCAELFRALSEHMPAETRTALGALNAQQKQALAQPSL